MIDEDVIANLVSTTCTTEGHAGHEWSDSRGSCPDCLRATFAELRANERLVCIEMLSLMRSESPAADVPAITRAIDTIAGMGR